jgi:hypothetical protein
MNSRFRAGTYVQLWTGCAVGRLLWPVNLFITSARVFHAKKKSAEIAPMRKAAINKVVVQQ